MKEGIKLRALTIDYSKRAGIDDINDVDLERHKKVPLEDGQVIFSDIGLGADDTKIIVFTSKKMPQILEMLDVILQSSKIDQEQEGFAAKAEKLHEEVGLEKLYHQYGYTDILFNMKIGEIHLHPEDYIDSEDLKALEQFIVKNNQHRYCIDYTKFTSREQMQYMMNTIKNAKLQSVIFAPDNRATRKKIESVPAPLNITIDDLIKEIENSTIIQIIFKQNVLSFPKDFNSVDSLISILRQNYDTLQTEEKCSVRLLYPDKHKLLPIPYPLSGSILMDLAKADEMKLLKDHYFPPVREIPWWEAPNPSFPVSPTQDTVPAVGLRQGTWLERILFSCTSPSIHR